MPVLSVSDPSLLVLLSEMAELLAEAERDHGAAARAARLDDLAVALASAPTGAVSVPVSAVRGRGRLLAEVVATAVAQGSGAAPDPDFVPLAAPGAVLVDGVLPVMPSFS